MVVPGVVIGFLVLVPFLDRSAERHPLSRSRGVFTAVFAAIGVGVGTLTTVGLSDRPLESSVVATEMTDDAAVAKEIYDTVCFACHKLGSDGGTVGTGPDACREPARLRDAARNHCGSAVSL